MTEIHTRERFGRPSGSRPSAWTFPPSVPSSTYVNHRTVDSSIHVAGQLPYKDGELLGQGILGRDVDLETGRELARQAALNALAVAADAVGDLDRVRIVQMLVFVASTPEFGQQSKVADAASELLVDVLGENGRHARTAIGVAEPAAEQSGRDPDGLHGGVGPHRHRTLPTLEECSVHRLQRVLDRLVDRVDTPVADRAGRRDAAQHRPDAGLRRRARPGPAASRQDAQVRRGRSTPGRGGGGRDHRRQRR